jgi:SARP family transcriptional regulator, regulator of embCAB operon
MTGQVDTAAGRAIGVVVVDDHEIVERLVRLLSQQPDLTVVATTGTVAAGVAAVGTHRPDIVVMDYLLPDGDGASAASRIRAEARRARHHADRLGCRRCGL